MNNLVAKILEIKVLESSSFKTNYSNVDLKQVTEQVISALKIQSDNKEIAKKFISYLLSEESQSLQAAVRAYEREHICRVLNKHNWNKVEAAKALNVGLSSLYRKIDELEIDFQKRRHNRKEKVAG